MHKIVWTEGPSTALSGRTPWPLYNVPPGEESYIRFLGSPFLTDVHWAGPRTLPHTGDACPLCKQGNLRRPAGYAPAQRWFFDANGVKNWINVVVSITDSALLDLRDHDIRGQVWTLLRVDKRVRSQLVARFCEMSQTPVPEAFDPRLTLEWIWRGYMAEINRPAPQEHKPQPRAKVDAGPGTVGDALNPLRGRLAEEFQARNGKGGVQ